MEPLPAECRDTRAYVSQAFGQNVPNAKTREGCAAMIQEHLRVGPKIDLAFLAKRQKDLCRLSPERTESFLSPFAEQAKLKWLHELQVVGAEVDDLMHACTGIEHCCEQGVVAAPKRVRAVDSSKDSFDLGTVQVFDDPLLCPFERNSEHSLGFHQLLWMVGANITKESVDGGEANVACRDAVAPFFLQEDQEGDDALRIEIVQVEIADFDLVLRRHETKKKEQAVAVTMDRVRAHPAEPREMSGKIILQTASQKIRGRRFHLHRAHPPTGTTTPP